MSGEALWTASRLSGGMGATPYCPPRTGVEGCLTRDSVVSICGTIKRLNVLLLQVLAVEAGSAGAVTMKVVELAAAMRSFCCVETPEGPGREGADMLAPLIDANRVMTRMLKAAGTTTLVTNASATQTESPVSVKAAMFVGGAAESLYTKDLLPNVLAVLPCERCLEVSLNVHLQAGC